MLNRGDAQRGHRSADWIAGRLEGLGLAIHAAFYGGSCHLGHGDSGVAAARGGHFGSSGREGPRARPLGRVLFWFFLRLILAAALLYVSLKLLDGKVFALVVGPRGSLLVALLIEALRLFRSWSA